VFAPSDSLGAASDSQPMSFRHWVVERMKVGRAIA